jgi:phospholipid/cholesterol/gamma-HCH transport system substrate-binding protein
VDKSRRTPAQIAVMAVFALSCFGLLTFLWASFGGSIPLNAKGYRIVIPMKETFGLAAVSDVRISGVPVGQVTRLTRSGDHTNVEIQVEPRYAPLPRGTRATLRRKTLLGEAYLELSPGPSRGAKLREGALLAAANVQPSVDVDEVLSTFDARTRRRTRQWLAGWAAGLRGRGGDLNAAFGHLPGALEAGDDLLSVLRGQQRATATLIGDTGRTFSTFAERDARVRELIESGDRVFTATAARDADLRATVDVLPGFVGALQRTLVSARRYSGPLRPVLTGLERGAPLLRPTLDRATAVAPSLEALAGDLDGFTRVAPRGLRSVRAFLAATQPLFGKLYPFGRQLAPILQYARLYKYELANSWPKVDAVLEARSKDLHGEMTHYLRATAVNSNDTLAGADRRQPYTRPSTYAAPGNIETLRTGTLHAFDCSHVGNPVQVQPIGPYPPCVEQKKVTFQGLTSQFPHVRAAP